MKLVVAGASGFVATETIRQSLRLPSITSVIAIARQPVLTPSNLAPDADAAKLHSVVLDSYDDFPEHVIQVVQGADACIWTVAITPSKSRGLDFEEVRRVCQEHTLAGLRGLFGAHLEGGGTAPFRFLYMSGAATERDQSKTPKFMPQYCLMRGETENQILAFAAGHKDAVEACVAKPGAIIGPDQMLKAVGATVLKYLMSLPSISVAECSAAMLHQVIHGFAKEPLENEDLVRIGRQALGPTQ